MGKEREGIEQQRERDKCKAALGGGRLEWPAAAHPEDTRVSRVGQRAGRARLCDRAISLLPDRSRTGQVGLGR